MEHFLACHEHAFVAVGGVPSKIMVDNLKSAALQARDDKTLEAPEDPFRVAVVPLQRPLMGEPFDDPLAQGG